MSSCHDMLSCHDMSPCHDMPSCHEIPSSYDMSWCHDMVSCHDMSISHATSGSQKLLRLNLDAHLVTWRVEARDAAVPTPCASSLGIIVFLALGKSGRASFERPRCRALPGYPALKLVCLNLDALTVPEALVNTIWILEMFSYRLNLPQPRSPSNKIASESTTETFIFDSAMLPGPSRAPPELLR